MPIKQLVYFSCSELIEGVSSLNEASCCTMEQINAEKMQKMKSIEEANLVDDEKHMATLFGGLDFHKRI